MRRRRDFLVTYQEGTRLHGRLTVLFARRSGPDQPWRLGQTATGKIGGAVVRNRLRRHGREIFRHWRATLPGGWDFVVNYKHRAVEADQAELRRDLLASLRRLGIDPEPAAHAQSGPPA